MIVKYIGRNITFTLFDNAYYSDVSLLNECDNLINLIVS